MGHLGKAVGLFVLAFDSVGCEAVGFCGAELGSGLFGLSCFEVFVVFGEQVEGFAEIFLLLEGLVEGLALGFGFGCEGGFGEEFFGLGRGLSEHRDGVVGVAGSLAGGLVAEVLAIRVASQCIAQAVDAFVELQLVIEQFGGVGLCFVEGELVGFFGEGLGVLVDFVGCFGSGSKLLRQ